MDTTNTNTAAEQQPPADADGKPDAKIDPQQIADRVYRMMQAELRLSRARGQRIIRRQER